MEGIADLVALAGEADIFEWSFGAPAVEPEAEDSLFGVSELSSAGEDAATVDPDGEAEGVGIFEGECFGGKFGCAVEGDGGGGGKFFGDAARGKVGREIASGDERIVD